MSQPRLRLYSYAACSTCRKALQWLEQHGYSKGEQLELCDITLSPPSREELRQAWDAVGRQRLFNTSGQSYRALGPAAVKAMSDDEALAALASDGKLIKRPFAITAEGAVLVGFKPEEWQAALLGS